MSLKLKLVGLVAAACFGSGAVAEVNTWVAAAAGNASDAANWSLERVPVASDSIELSEASAANLTWDAGVNGLPDTVAGWSQSVLYMGVVTFPITYPEADTVFTNLTVSGDVVINGGSWTHPTNGAAQVSRLCVSVGGSFTLAAGCKIDLQYKGYSPGRFPAGSIAGAHASGRSAYSQAYGDVYRPRDLGAGGELNVYSAANTCAGGGALWLEVAGECAINGTCNASSLDVGNSNTQKAPGAGGSIYIQAGAITGSGLLTASGAISQKVGSSGGRIALVLTEASALGIPLANVQARGNCGDDGKSYGGGTAYIKTADQLNGLLLVDSLNSASDSFYTCMPSVYGTVCVKPGEVWTFDSIITRGQGVLSVPTNSTLRLPNGFFSVTSTDTSLYDGIIYMGGAIDVPETGSHTFRSNWVFHAHVPFTLNGDVNVVQRGALGCIPRRNTLSNFTGCRLNVTGNLVVDSSGTITGDRGGVDWDDSDRRLVTHGGQPGTNTTLGISKVYGSVFAPATPGMLGSSPGRNSAGFAKNYRTQGGGVIKLAVGGTLQLDGRVSVAATNATYDVNAGSGGALDIVAGRLTGSASSLIMAYGGAPSSTASQGWYSGGGGRIAIRLTEPGATFEAFGESKIRAYSDSANVTATLPERMGSAGTIYLQTLEDGEGGGRIVIRSENKPANNLAVTPLPSMEMGGENDVYDNVRLELSSRARVQLWAPLRMKRLSMEADTLLDLHSQRLRVQRAFMNGAELALGDYSAKNLPAYLADSIGGGILSVTGEPMLLQIR